MRRGGSAQGGPGGVRGRGMLGEKSPRSSNVAQLRREFQDATRKPVRAQARQQATGPGARPPQPVEGSVEQEYIHNLQQQVYFLELECQFLRASLEGGGQPGTDASGHHLAAGVGPAGGGGGFGGGKASQVRAELDLADKKNEELTKRVRARACAGRIRPRGALPGVAQRPLTALRPIAFPRPRSNRWRR